LPAIGPEATNTTDCAPGDQAVDVAAGRCSPNLSIKFAPTERNSSRPTNCCQREAIESPPSADTTPEERALGASLEQHLRAAGAKQVRVEVLATKPGASADVRIWLAARVTSLSEARITSEYRSARSSLRPTDAQAEFAG
jgi:hypothetical protein